MDLLSRKATCNSHGQDSSYFLGWEEYEKNPHDVVKNPHGIIQMGLAENQVTNITQLHIHVITNRYQTIFMYSENNIYFYLLSFCSYASIF